MRNCKAMTLLATALVTLGAIEPVLADGPRRGNGSNRDGYEEGNRDAYRDGYRNGFGDGRGNRRFDDRAGPPQVARDERHDGDERGDRDRRWKGRYSRVYTYNDDTFYKECRQTVDPAGVLVGGLIGGLLGNAVGRDGHRTGATVAGVIVGGVVGAALTRNLDCEDRSHAYKTYSDGFNAGRPNSSYEWRNPRNGHTGQFRVGNYYDDEDGFRCANYTQKIFVDGRPQAASGRACQQPDGTWTIVG